MRRHGQNDIRHDAQPTGEKQATSTINAEHVAILSNVIRRDGHGARHHDMMLAGCIRKDFALLIFNCVYLRKYTVKAFWIHDVKFLFTSQEGFSMMRDIQKIFR